MESLIALLIRTGLEIVLGIDNVIFIAVLAGKDVILLLGWLFQAAKSTFEIHDKLEGAVETSHALKAVASLAGVIVQMMLLVVVFSLDSVITAVGAIPAIAITHSGPSRSPIPTMAIPHRSEATICGSLSVYRRVGEKDTRVHDRFVR